MLTFVLIAKHTPYYLAGHALIVKVEEARAISYGRWLTFSSQIWSESDAYLWTKET